MKKIMSYVLCVAITASSVLANQDVDTCQSLKGDFVWNGTLNQWQCENLSDADKDTYAKYIIGKDTSEGNTTAAYAQPRNNENETSSITGKDILVTVLTPFALAATVVTVVALSPIWIIKSVAGND